MVLHKSMPLATLIGIAAAFVTTACSSGASAPDAAQVAGSPAAISFASFYQATQKLSSAERAASLKTLSAQSFHAVYKGLLGSTSNAKIVIGDAVFTGLRDKLLAREGAILQLDGQFSSIGSYWHTLGFNPSAALSESTLTADLQALAKSLNSPAKLALDDTVHTGCVLPLPAGVLTPEQQANFDPSAAAAAKFGCGEKATTGSSALAATAGVPGPASATAAGASIVAAADGSGG